MATQTERHSAPQAKGERYQAQPYQVMASFSGDVPGLVMDVPPEKGGGDNGPSPHQLLLASLAGCTAMTVSMYANHKQWPLESIHVSVSQQDHKAEFPIEKAITLVGAELTEEQRERLMAVAEKCPVNQLLKQPVTVNVVQA